MRWLHDPLRSDPQRYLRIVEERLQRDPDSPDAYFDRHFAWMRLGQPRRALDDLNKVVALAPSQSAFMSRGEVYRHLGQYEDALQDFGRAEAMDPHEWELQEFGPFFQADCHARLGQEAEALAHCARLPDDFWTPGIFGAPSSGKTQIAEQLRQMAAGARAARA
jgi:tetratricopeptide (TPR) repeat protein